MFVAVALFKFSWLTVCIAVFASVSALVSCFFMPSESMIHFLRENGPVENLTLVFYVVAIAFILYSGRSFLTVRTRVAVTVLLAYMFMREASLHKSVSTMSILKSKFWLGSQIPWTDKLLAIAILAPVLWALFYFVEKYIRQWWSDLRRKDGYAVGVFVFLAVLVISKIFDRSLNMMHEMWGWHFDSWVEAMVTGQEEYLECILPLLVLVSFYQYREVYGTLWKQADSPFVSVWLALLASFSALICQVVLPTGDMSLFVQENGTVETLTLVAYVVAIIVVVCFGRRVVLPTRCAILMVLAYMFMGEMDLHKRISSESILKIRFWLGSQIPVADKLLAVLVLFPLAWSIAYLILRHARIFIGELVRKRAWSVSVLTFFVVLAVSKSIDRMVSVLTDFSCMYFPDWVLVLRTSQEEFLEFLLPVLVLVAFLQYRQQTGGFFRHL